MKTEAKLETREGKFRKDALGETRWWQLTTRYLAVFVR